MHEYLAQLLAALNLPPDDAASGLTQALGVIAGATGSDLMRALAYAGFLINLINLIPVGILDGGSIWRSIQLARRSVEAPPGQEFAMGSTYPIAIPGGGPTRATQIVVLYGLLATLLVIGMIATHVTQHRL